MTSNKRQHNIWDRQLKKQWADEGRTRCVWRRCGSQLGLAPAHSRKRRLINTRELYFTAAPLCTAHHHYVEYGDRKHRGTHRRMERLIKVLIAQEQYGIA